MEVGHMCEVESFSYIVKVDQVMYSDNIHGILQRN